MPLMGQREYARHRAELKLPGATHRAVQKAIAAQRIAVVDGKIDSELADKAWADNSSEGHRRQHAFTDPAAAGGAAVANAAPARHPSPPQATAPSDGKPTFSQVATFEKAQRGKLAQLQVAKLEGSLVSAEKVKGEWASLVLLARNKILGAALRIKEKIPELTAAHVRTIEGVLREALEDLADGSER